MHPITHKVICPCVPESIRNVLSQWQDDKKRVIFSKVFGDMVKNATPGSFDEVINLYQRAQDKYHRAHASLETGMRL